MLATCFIAPSVNIWIINLMEPLDTNCCNLFSIFVYGFSLIMSLKLLKKKIQEGEEQQKGKFKMLRWSRHIQYWIGVSLSLPLLIVTPHKSVGLRWPLRCGRGSFNPTEQGQQAVWYHHSYSRMSLQLKYLVANWNFRNCLWKDRLPHLSFFFLHSPHWSHCCSG